LEEDRKQEEAKQKTALDRKDYHFKCGIIATQEECTLTQDKELIRVLSKINFKDVNDLRNMPIADIINMLCENDIIEKIFDIILKVHDSPENWKWGLLKRSEVAEVIEDFFTLSPVLIKWFGNGNFAQVLKSASQ
jgi:UDP-glucose 6-dehydrogenase